MKPVEILDLHPDTQRRPFYLELVDEGLKALDRREGHLVDLSALPADRIWLLQGSPAAGYSAQVMGDDTRPFQRSTFHRHPQAAVDELALLAASGATLAAARGITQTEDEAEDQAAADTDRIVRVAGWLTFGCLVAAALFWHFSP